MHWAYVDESYNANYMFVSCALGTPDQWEAVSQGFRDVRADTSAAHGTAPNIELHGHEIMSGSGNWSPLRKKHREAAAIYSRSLGVMADAGIEVIVRGVDVARLNARYRYPRPPYALALQFTLERLNEHMEGRCSGAPVTVVADEVHTQEQHRREFANYQDGGTPWYRASKLDCVDSLTYADSCEEDGLQAADLAIYLYRRNHGVIWEKAPENAKSAKVRKRLMRRLRPMLHASSGLWEP